MLGFEPYITKAIGIYAQQMDNLVLHGQAGRYAELGKVDSKISERQKKGESAFDAAKWSAFLAFDIIGDLVCNPIIQMTSSSTTNLTGVWIPVRFYSCRI
jgi:benzoate 4-monooxygenase